jgi:hypothetical protein
MIVDIVFFVTILLLLWQLNRRIGQQRPPVDRKGLLELEKMMARSQEQADRFLQELTEREQGIHKLLRQLDSQERKLLILIEQAEALTRGTGGRDASPDPYAQVLQMIRQGLSREEVISRSGLTEGEINLVIELAQARAGHP